MPHEPAGKAVDNEGRGGAATFRDRSNITELTGASTLGGSDGGCRRTVRGVIFAAIYRTLSTRILPLDDVLNGGLRPGELLVSAPSGVGKTVFALRLARNIALFNRDAVVMYICYEHDRWHIMMRLLCMESALLRHGGTRR